MEQGGVFSSYICPPFLPNPQPLLLSRLSVPHLELIPFQAIPVVDFSHVRVGTTASLPFTVHNPTSRPIQLTFEGYGQERLKDLRFTMPSAASECSLVVPPGSQQSVLVSWTPAEHGSFHENIILKANTGVRFHVLTQGHAVVATAKTEVLLPSLPPLPPLLPPLHPLHSLFIP